MSDNPLQAPSPQDLAELLPQYGIESFIAQGGMGAVYKASQLSLERDVAIKVLLYQFGGDEEFRESFTTEAKAMARLNHPNLLGVFDFGEVNGMPYIVMEYVEGGSLHEAAYNQAIDPSQAVGIVKAICDGLAHAHENGIVHRDIKPSNILLTPNAVPKVADFGLAHAGDSDRPGLVMGTPGYTAPEVFQDPNQAGTLADIYSVGVILHQLLSGIDPSGSMSPPTKATGKLRLDSIWRKATHIDPTQRYPSIVAMADDLDKWSISLQTQNNPTISAGPKPYQPSRYPVQPIKTKSGGGVFAKSLFVVILLGAVASAYLFLQKQKAESPQAISDSDTHTATTQLPKHAPKHIPEHVPALNLDEIHVPLPSIAGDSDTKSEPEPETKPKSDIADTGKDEETDTAPTANIEPEKKQDLPPGDPDLRARAVALILDARKKRNVSFIENARALVANLDTNARSAAQYEAASIERLKGDIVDGMIPITDEVKELPEEIAKYFSEAHSKEQSIKSTHRSELTRIRDAYVTRLLGAASENKDTELKDRLLAQAERAKDLDEWIALLSPEPEKTPKTSTGYFGASCVLGNWNFHSERYDSHWIAHPDGKMEIVDREREATWKILEDGSLEVSRGDSRSYTFKRDGNGWASNSSLGRDVSLSRGDW